MKVESRPTKVRILVVEDHAVVRSGFVALINREADMEVCGEAETAPQAMSLMGKERPDVVVVDLVLREGNGIDLVKSARALYPKLPLLIISMQSEEVYAERCLRAGASGYIMKNAATEEFLDAIRAILKGEIFISKKMNVRLLRRVAGQPASEKKTGIEELSDRELQVFQMIGAGMTPRQIAPQLGISPKTVATHRENIKVKLNLKDGKALLTAALQWIESTK